MRRIMLCDTTDIMLAYIALYEYYMENSDDGRLDLPSLLQYFTPEFDKDSVVVTQGFLVEQELYEDFLRSLDFLDAYNYANGGIYKCTAYTLYITYLKCLSNEYACSDKLPEDKDLVLRRVLMPNIYGKLEYAEDGNGDSGYSEVIQEIVNKFNQRYGR